jgi:hypothetical protein
MAAMMSLSISALLNGQVFTLSNEGQKVSFEVVADRRTGRSSADRLEIKSQLERSSDAEIIGEIR